MRCYVLMTDGRIRACRLLWYLSKEGKTTRDFLFYFFDSFQYVFCGFRLFWHQTWHHELSCIIVCLTRSLWGLGCFRQARSNFFSFRSKRTRGRGGGETEHTSHFSQGESAAYLYPSLAFIYLFLFLSDSVKSGANIYQHYFNISIDYSTPNKQV